MGQSEKFIPRKRKVDKQVRVVSEVFDITEVGANIMLRRLAKEAHLSLTGRVHFHKLRGWVMNGLSGAHFNEFQIKFCVGKAIPMTDATYLYGLQEQIETRYPKAFEEHLNLKAPSKAIVDLAKSLEAKSLEIERLKAKVMAIEASEHNSVGQAEAEIARLNEVFGKRLGAFEAWAKSQGYTGGALISDETPERWKKAQIKKKLSEAE